MELCMTTVAGREVINQGLIVSVPVACEASLATKRKSEKGEDKSTPKIKKVRNHSSSRAPVGVREENTPHEFVRKECPDMIPQVRTAISAKFVSFLEYVKSWNYPRSKVPMKQLWVIFLGCVHLADVKEAHRLLLSGGLFRKVSLKNFEDVFVNVTRSIKSIVKGNERTQVVKYAQRVVTQRYPEIEETEDSKQKESDNAEDKQGEKAQVLKDHYFFNSTDFTKIHTSLMTTGCRDVTLTPKKYSFFAGFLSSNGIRRKSERFSLFSYFENYGTTS